MVHHGHDSKPACLALANGHNEVGQVQHPQVLDLTEQKEPDGEDHEPGENHEPGTHSVYQISSNWPGDASLNTGETEG